MFVVGDLAAATSADTGQPVPGVAQGAMQMGHFVGQAIAAEVSGRSTPEGRTAFVYRDKGSMAVIGKASAVAQIGRVHLSGFVAWAVWAVVHVTFLVNFRNRVFVMLSLFWNWLLNARDARLITGEAELDIERVGPASFVPTDVAPPPARPSGHSQDA